MLEHAPLQAVYIYFDTATYDEIERDEKVLFYHLYLLPASVLEHAPLEAVYIYFDTTTYDEIERDEKVNALTSKGSALDVVLIKEM